jgi:hypothetical protein
VNIRLQLLIYAFFNVMFLGSCATPVPPTGGPQDRTGPEIEETSPVNETVNFDEREIRITFSKFVNRSSLLNAINIEPDLAIGYEIKWRRKTAIIEFDRALPANTTVILKIGTELTDTNNNKMPSQYDLAISTGDVIDDGRVTARVRRAADGITDSGFRIFLYRQPFDLSERANYVAQTDTSGRVQFSYLAEDTYKAIWVDDSNRNRIWDRDRELAQPFHDSTFTIQKGEELDLGTIYTDNPDTIRPDLRGVGLLTEEMLRMRFSEEIYWDDNSTIQVKDTLGADFTEAFPLYLLPQDPLILIAQSLDPLPEDGYYTVQLNGFTDRAGNPARLDLEPFTGSSQPDTIRTRIIGDNAEPGLFPDEGLVIGYNKFIVDDDIVDSLRVVEGDQMIEDWPHYEVDRHRLRVMPNGQWESGINYQFLVWNPDREQLRPYEPTIWQRNQLGAIEFIVDADSLDNSEYFLTLYDEERKVEIDTTFTETIEIDRLPPLNYSAIVYRDDDETSRWNPGSVIPFQAPEPYFVRKDIPVREGFTSELEIVFDNKP